MHLKKNVLTTTFLFRADLEWGKLFRYIEENLSFNHSKINTYCLASSDGSEAYSYAMTVLDRALPQERSKYLPVMASDIDEEMVMACKSGKINLTGIDFQSIANNLLFSKSYFKDAGDEIEIENNRPFQEANVDYRSYRPIKELGDGVVFEKADILEKVKSIKDEGNSVILCRNVFMYLQQNYIIRLVSELGKVLKQGSLFVIGDCDSSLGVKNFLNIAGFQEVMKNVFKRL
ncbi:hypothetical protein IJ750_02280 [bacterium]|nr:hypothetical protein [bacterium]